MTQAAQPPSLDPSALRLSRRAQAQKAPSTLAMSARTRALQQRGIDVISFGLGEPDFDTPEPIRAAAIHALNHGQTHYMPTLGDAETRSAIAQKLERENGIVGLTADHVAISTGAKHSLWLIYQALLDQTTGPDDAADVLLPVPAWVSYRPMVELCGGRIVEIPSTVESGFKITPQQLRSVITPRSRLLMMNTPSNPCGTMYSEADLRALGAVVAEAARTIAPQLVVVVDEIYEKICYGGVRHFSMGAIPEIAQRTVTVNGMSKAFAMTGWRVGYCAAPGAFGAQLIRAIDALQGQQTSCITSFVYPAVREAIARGGAFSAQFCEKFAARGRLMHELASAIPGLRLVKPTGAFYLFPDVSAYFGCTTPGGRTITSALAFAEALLDEGHVTVVPGEEFGGCGKNHIRLSFACNEDTIRTGMHRLANFCASLKPGPSTR